MEMAFHETQVRMLTRLHEIAQKHKCSIQFGTRNKLFGEPDFELLGNLGLDKALFNILTFIPDAVTITDWSGEDNIIWFELEEKTKMKHNTLSYCERECKFTIDLSALSEFNQNIVAQHLREVGGEAISEYVWKVHLHQSTSFTRGFNKKQWLTENKEEIKATQVFTAFTGLVCDYLREPLVEKIEGLK